MFNLENQIQEYKYFLVFTAYLMIRKILNQVKIN